MQLIRIQCICEYNINNRQSVLRYFGSPICGSMVLVIITLSFMFFSSKFMCIHDLDYGVINFMGVIKWYKLIEKTGNGMLCNAYGSIIVVITY